MIAGNSKRGLGQVIANLNEPMVDINQPLGQPLVDLTSSSGSSASGATTPDATPTQTLLLLGALLLLIMMVTRK